MIKKQSGWQKIALYGFMIRVVLILFLSCFENIEMQELKMTDIDYKVYSDAAAYDSPYERHTYRYTPLIAYLMSFNYSVHNSIGKIFFAFADVVAMGFLWVIVAKKTTNSRLKNAIKAVKIYSYNPLFIYLTVRGSCESLNLAMMYAFWYYFCDTTPSISQQKSQQNQSSRTVAYVLYGLWVHLRVYPIIFLPFMIMRQKSQSARLKELIKVGIIGGGTFLALGAFFYWLYGNDFIEETYLYHLSRKDNRHSFSAYFYEIYLNSVGTQKITRSFIRVVPTLYIILTISLKYAREYSPFFIHLMLTVGFVTFNKVITMQYYMWIIGAIILVLPESYIFIRQKHRVGYSLALQYVFPILIWIWLSIKLESSGENNFYTMWIICIFQVYFHLWVLSSFIKSVQFKGYQNAVVKKQQKKD